MACRCGQEPRIGQTSCTSAARSGGSVRLRQPTSCPPLTGSGSTWTRCPTSAQAKSASWPLQVRANECACMHTHNVRAQVLSQASPAEGRCSRDKTPHHLPAKLRHILSTCSLQSINRHSVLAWYSSAELSCWTWQSPIPVRTHLLQMRSICLLTWADCLKQNGGRGIQPTNRQGLRMAPCTPSVGSGECCKAVH